MMLNFLRAKALLILTRSGLIVSRIIPTLYFKVLFMNKRKYIEDLKDIKDIMDRSTRFISLSGLSGVFAGIFALIGAYLAYETVYSQQDYLGLRKAILTESSIGRLLLIAAGTLSLSVIAGIFFTTRKARRSKQKIWDTQSKRLIINLLIPLIGGGLICLVLLVKGFVGLVAPLSLVFYGLALVNASHYTLSEVRSLGIIEMILGIVATYFIGYGLFFWAIGFGVMHIIYGIIMQIRYGS